MFRVDPEVQCQLFVPPGKNHLARTQRRSRVGRLVERISVVVDNSSIDEMRAVVSEVERMAGGGGDCDASAVGPLAELGLQRGALLTECCEAMAFVGFDRFEHQPRVELLRRNSQPSIRLLPCTM